VIRFNKRSIKHGRTPVLMTGQTTRFGIHSPVIIWRTSRTLPRLRWSLDITTAE